MIAGSHAGVRTNPATSKKLAESGNGSSGRGHKL